VLGEGVIPIPTYIYIWLCNTVSLYWYAAGI
jgi:hypothetical protein